MKRGVVRELISDCLFSILTHCEKTFDGKVFMPPAVANRNRER